MEKKQEQIELGYRIIKIHTTKFIFEDSGEEIIVELFNKMDGLGLNIKSSLNIEKEKSIITIDIGTKLIDKLNGKTLVEHSGRTSYHLLGLDKIYNKDKDAYDLPDDLALQFYSIAYTHARALLAAEISPTVYKDKYFLPVIDPSHLIKRIRTEEPK